MRVVLLHNRYRQAGGEERAVAEIAGLLERAGHAVHRLEVASEEVSAGGAARAMLAGGAEAESVADAVRSFGADVVHAHNLTPRLGWRALAAARQAGARTVLHLHNLRLFCAIGVAYRDAMPCYDCHGGWTLPGVVHRCRGGLAESAVYAAGLGLWWRRTLRESDAVVAVSAATAARVRALGVNGPVEVLPNFAAAVAGAVRRAPGEYAMVAGRLVEEKGYDTAILACAAARVPLVVCGTGPDEPRLRALAAAEGADVRFRGLVSEAEVTRARDGAIAVLAPSRWEEPCPYAVIDALAAGVPVIGSDRGGLPELLAGQRVCSARDVPAFAAALGELAGSPEAWAERAAAARAFALAELSAERHLGRLESVYAG